MGCQWWNPGLMDAMQAPCQTSYSPNHPNLVFDQGMTSLFFFFLVYLIFSPNTNVYLVLFPFPKQSRQHIPLFLGISFQLQLYNLSSSLFSMPSSRQYYCLLLSASFFLSVILHFQSEFTQQESSPVGTWARQPKRVVNCLMCACGCVEGHSSSLKLHEGFSAVMSLPCLWFTL